MNTPINTCESWVCPKHQKNLAQSKWQEKHCYCPTIEENGAYCSYKCWKDSGKAVERNWQSPIRNGNGTKQIPQEEAKKIFAEEVFRRLDELKEELGIIKELLNK